MKIILHSIIASLCILCIGCFPGIKADRINGIVIDRSSNLPLQGVEVYSTDPSKGSQSRSKSPNITDKEGRFSLPPNYGFVWIFGPGTGWRNIDFTKEGYSTHNISVLNRPKRNERFVHSDDHKHGHIERYEDLFVVKLK